MKFGVLYIPDYYEERHNSLERFDKYVLPHVRDI